MNPEQNQQELSFEQLLDFSNFSLEAEEEKVEEVIQENDLKTEEEEIPKEDIPVLEDESKEVKKEEPKEEINFSSGEDFYSRLIQENLSSGDWEDVLVEDEEGNEVKLSEIKDIDKEKFDNIKEALKAKEQEEFSEKFISVEGVDEVKKRLINIVKNGDLELAKALFENPESLKEPFQGYDYENDTHNEQVLAWYYTNVLKHSSSETRALVNSAKSDLSLDEKAQKIVEYQRAQFYTGLENKEQELQQEKINEQERIKQYRKDLTVSLKGEGLNEPTVRKFVDLATKTTKNGSFEIDEVYEEWMTNPDKAKELIFFLLDKENYLKKVTGETKKNVQLDNLKKIRIIQDNSKVSKQKKEEEAPITAFEQLSFE
jgi:hypothetical protein